MSFPHISLLACYELGHQPLSLAWPTAVLEAAGFTVTARDLAVDPLNSEEIKQADLVGIAVPMHTAMRLGVQAARRVRQINPDAHICFYGLYGWLNADYLLERQNGRRSIADSVISGEVEAPLLALARQIRAGVAAGGQPGISTAVQRSAPYRERLKLPVPRRSGLPALNHYARYMSAGHSHLAGYVEASRGCLHTCSHCPVVPVYDGRFFVMPAETVLADIRQQVAAGARHITFGDPDFLNGPGHALKIVRAIHTEFPGLTFDFTTKVEHILSREALLPELRASGAAFVVSAFESVSDEVLTRLRKGHTRADMDRALEILDASELPVQPTWVAFTPWTTLDDYLAMLDWIHERALIPHIPAVQYAIRLLVPPNSSLLSAADNESWLGSLEADNFGYSWQHPDPCMDWLHQQVSRLIETGDADPYTTFGAVRKLAYQAAGRPQPDWQPPAIPLPAPPRLTEDWFC